MSERDWGGLRVIVSEARQITDNPRPEVACPRCGTPLQVNKDGVKNCPMGHYRTNQ